MACYYPLRAWRLDNGDVSFKERGAIHAELQIACGQCIGCRLERSRQWAVRCVHEASMHTHNSFVTLTYDDDHVPEDGSLHYRDFQLFMKRLRKRVGKARFFMCGEYGETSFRPHYHACLFGVNFGDRVLFRRMESGSDTYTSKLLSELWPDGFSTVGEVTFDSAAYCARYVVKKVTGNGAEDHYMRVMESTGEIVKVEPEFCHMSLGGRNKDGGIGAAWIDKYYKDVYSYDKMIVNGVEVSPPRYYDKRFKEKIGNDMELMNQESIRDIRNSKRIPDVRARLDAKEKVARARLNFKKRAL